MADGDGEGRIGLVATVGVALLALLTVCVVASSRDDAVELAGSQRPSEPPELAEVWRTPYAEGGLAAAALWPGDAALTRVTRGGGVEAFDTVDGARLWRAAPPEGAEPEPCAAGERVNASGVGAVLYRSAASGGGCSVLAVVDTRADGALVWSAELAGQQEQGEAGEAGEAAAVTIGEETVTVSLDREGGLPGFHRFDLDSGEELPLPEPPAADGEDGCEWQTLSAWHAGSRFLTLNACGAAGALNVYDADTGRLEWTHEAEEGVGCTGMLAGDPVLLFEGDELVAYSETGEELWRRPVGEEPGELAPGDSVVVDGVLLSRYADEAGRPAYAAYGLADGERRWTRRLPPGTRVFGVDGNGLPLLGSAEDDRPRLRLRWLDPEDGTEMPAGSVPAGDQALIASDADQLYVLTRLATGDGEPRLGLRAFER